MDNYIQIDGREMPLLSVDQLGIVRHLLILSIQIEIHSNIKWAKSKHWRTLPEVTIRAMSRLSAYSSSTQPYVTLRTCVYKVLH